MLWLDFNDLQISQGHFRLDILGRLSAPPRVHDLAVFGHVNGSGSGLFRESLHLLLAHQHVVPGQLALLLHPHRDQKHPRPIKVREQAVPPGVADVDVAGLRGLALAAYHAEVGGGGGLAREERRVGPVVDRAPGVDGHGLVGVGVHGGQLVGAARRQHLQQEPVFPCVMTARRYARFVEELDALAHPRTGVVAVGDDCQGLVLVEGLVEAVYVIERYDSIFKAPVARSFLTVPSVEYYSWREGKK